MWITVVKDLISNVAKSDVYWLQSLIIILYGFHEMSKKKGIRMSLVDICTQIRKNKSDHYGSEISAE